MKKSDNYLSEEKRELYTRFLNTNDCKKVAEITGYSESGVNNIFYQRTSLNDDNRIVIVELDRICRQRIKETEDYIEKVRHLNLVK